MSKRKSWLFSGPIGEERSVDRSAEPELRPLFDRFNGDRSPSFPSRHHLHLFYRQLVSGSRVRIGDAQGAQEVVVRTVTPVLRIAPEDFPLGILRGVFDFVPQAYRCERQPFFGPSVPGKNGTKRTFQAGARQIRSVVHVLYLLAEFTPLRLPLYGVTDKRRFGIEILLFEELPRRGAHKLFGDVRIARVQGVYHPLIAEAVGDATV